jgi:diketogulonate reductase-like aldo/keto reductase
MVRTVKLSNGQTIPALGYGAMVGHTGKAAELCASALKAGIMHLDTAQVSCSYGDHAKQI